VIISTTDLEATGAVDERGREVILRGLSRESV